MLAQEGEKSMLKKSFVAMLLASSMLVASSPADAALNAYLRLKAAKIGDIKGSSTQKGREGQIMVIAVEQTTSKAVGGRTNTAPLLITKEVDTSSPLLHQALANGEVMTEFTLQFWRAMPTGGEEQYYTVKLTNARITNMRTVLLNTKDPELQRYEPREEVTFTYDTIEWTLVKGGVTAQERNGG
jgi:type VI secretion system secreted protein Hcp